jgi:hypothetical protein
VRPVRKVVSLTLETVRLPTKGPPHEMMGGGLP